MNPGPDGKFSKEFIANAERFANDDEFNRINHVKTRDDENKTNWKGPWVDKDCNPNYESEDVPRDKKNFEEIAKIEKRIELLLEEYKKMTPE